MGKVEGKKSTVHVITSNRGGWSVTRSNRQRALIANIPYNRAVIIARRLAKLKSLDLYLHRRDGMVSNVIRFSK